MARVFEKRGEWWIDYRGADGRRHREPVGAGATHNTAKMLLAKRQAEAAEQRHFPGRVANSKPFSVVADRFWELHGQHMRSGTWRYLFAKIKTAFGSRRIGDITAADVQTFYNQIASARSHSTANRYLTLTRSIFNKAATWGDFHGINPCSGVKKGREANHRLRYLTVPEIERLLSVAHPRLTPVLACALLLGMRRGEMLALAWENVDLARGRLYILTSKSGRARELPIPPKLRDIFMSLGPKPNGPVFDIPLIMLRRHFAKALRDAGITSFRFHDLRHTAASHMVMNGVDLLTIARILGHSSTAMTQRYAHLAESYLASKMESFQAAMPLPTEFSALGWHQGRHQASADLQENPKLLSTIKQ